MYAFGAYTYTYLMSAHMLVFVHTHTNTHTYAHRARKTCLSICISRGLICKHICSVYIENERYKKSLISKHRALNSLIKLYKTQLFDLQNFVWSFHGSKWCGFALQVSIWFSGSTKHPNQDKHSQSPLPSYAWFRSKPWENIEFPFKTIQSIHSKFNFGYPKTQSRFTDSSWILVNQV